MDQASGFHSEQLRISRARTDKRDSSLRRRKLFVLRKKRLKAQRELPLRGFGMRQRQLEKSLPEPAARPAGRQRLTHSLSERLRSARQATQMLGQHGLDIRFDLPRQDRRRPFGANGYNDRVTIYYGGGDEVTLFGLIQHIDPGAGLSRPLCKLCVSRLVIRGRVNQPHALEISRGARPRLQREPQLIRPLTHRLRRRLTE